jgi:hypothetical protein
MWKFLGRDGLHVSSVKFKSRSVLGYGAHWPLAWREMWDYYTTAEQALKISGPDLSFGTQAAPLFHRPHELNGARELLARGAEPLGYRWTPSEHWN